MGWVVLPYHSDTQAVRVDSSGGPCFCRSLAPEGAAGRPRPGFPFNSCLVMNPWSISSSGVCLPDTPQIDGLPDTPPVLIDGLLWIICSWGGGLSKPGSSDGSRPPSESKKACPDKTQQGLGFHTGVLGHLASPNQGNLGSPCGSSRGSGTD